MQEVDHIKMVDTANIQQKGAGNVERRTAWVPVRHIFFYILLCYYHIQQLLNPVNVLISKFSLNREMDRWTKKIIIKMNLKAF